MARRHRTTLLLTVLLLGCFGCQSNRSAVAPLSSTLSRYDYPISTSSAEAQQWFNQGLVLMYGFNHDEAIRAFEQAAAADPDHPMPWWGIAQALGPNINDSMMTEDRWRAASEAAQSARDRIANGTPSEADLVRAISKRYTWPAPAAQGPYDQAFADGMQVLWQRYPNDPDIGTLYAESLMDLQPWDYWTNDGEPKGRAVEIVETIEAVLTIDPDHPGGLHLYIHALEASPEPDRALAAADLLCNRIPGAGHLVHMPSHIYVRVGQYADAADANVRAVAADRAYFETAPAPDLYWIYYAHNLHFLAFASMMEGRYETALEAARAMERDIPEYAVRKYGFLMEGIMSTTYHVQIRFGKWEEILRERQRPSYRLVTRAVHHYARGIAFSALGRTAEARAEVTKFDRAAAAIPGDWMMFNNAVDTVLPIARDMLEGELAFREGRQEAAFEALRSAVIMEDALVYDEPPAWMLPIRHPLGAFLMSAGRYAEAEEVYREDQRRNRNNGWSLLGLQQALEAQGRDAEAQMIGTELAVAWARSDTRATSSCLCEPRAQWTAQAGP